jgi:F420 biosynthesis protein FbiB-like protein
MNDPIDTLKFRQWITGRRSIRSFRPDPIPEDLIRRVLNLACFAPSAHNAQPWRFVSFPHVEDRKRLADVLTSQMQRDWQSTNDPDAIQKRVERTHQRFQDAPLAILVCCEHPESVLPAARSEMGERTLRVQSVASVTYGLLLAAFGEGLGACWMGYPAFCPAIAFSEFGFPAQWEPQAAVLFGYPNEQPATPVRLPLDQILITIGRNS